MRVPVAIGVFALILLGSALSACANGGTRVVPLRPVTPFASPASAWGQQDWRHCRGASESYTDCA